MEISVMKTLLMLLPIAAFLPLSQSPTQAAPITCTINNRNGNSPIGMRNAFTLKQVDRNTLATYDSFPSNAGSYQGNSVAIATTRTLIFYNMSIDRAREAMLSKPSFYTELIGFQPEKGFKSVNDLLTCTAAATPKTIADLPDGQYSYWTGRPKPPERKMSDVALLKSGGVLYNFTKTGVRLTGSFAPIDGETICVEGIILGNKLTGMAYPADGMGSNSVSRFSWHPSGYLQVGGWEPAKPGKPAHYHEAELDLSAFNPVVLDQIPQFKTSCITPSK